MCTSGNGFREIALDICEMKRAIGESTPVEQKTSMMGFLFEF